MPQHRGPVLVVDDDEAVRHSLKFSLELEGLAVRLYADAAQLLRDVLRDAALPRMGCLVVDDRMPGMDGVQLVGQLRAHDIDLPAILITARPSPALARRAAEAGFRRVVEKPFEDGSLLDGIRDALAAAAPG
ncbi:response regulator transcription factor [Methylorubrum zatmanii]|uniref:Response regulator transcription factor n=1 Tax=Methylorubrum zatmanii TaxID=29429 RepID=A0ABW1WNJ1_9HYPH